MMFIDGILLVYVELEEPIVVHTFEIFVSEFSNQPLDLPLL